MSETPGPSAERCATCGREAPLREATHKRGRFVCMDEHACFEQWQRNKGIQTPERMPRRDLNGEVNRLRFALAEAETALADLRAKVKALADEWDGTVYKLPHGYPMTVNEFCRYWFKAPLRALLAKDGA